MSEKLFIWMMEMAQKYGLAGDLPDIAEQRKQAEAREQARHEATHVVQQTGDGQPRDFDEDER